MKKLISTAFITLSSITLSAEKPNIVLIFADDLGYGDLSCYGATKIKTPHIDKLAKQGRIFTDAHSASAVCSPSRYGKLTGEYPYRVNYWGPVGNDGALTIDTKKETVSSMLKKAGYQTAFFGKWHLGFGKKAPDWNTDLKPGPLELGFDYYYGIPCANSVPPYVYVENYRVVGLDKNDPIGVGRKKHVRVLPEKGGGKIGGGKVAHDLYVDEQIGTNLTERSIKWMEETDKDKPFFLCLSTTNVHHPFTPAKQFKDTSDAGIYGDFTHELDWITGEIMKSLEEQGVADNTILIFTSDNGGMLNQGGQRAVKKGHQLNGDLLGSKFGAWEGGHRVPMIIRWNGKIPADTKSDALISHIDFLATFAAAAGQELPEPADSLNQLETLTGTPETPVRETLMICPNSPRHLSVRKGDWVYIPGQSDGGFRGQKPGKTLGGPMSVKITGKTNSDIKNGKLLPNAPKAQLYNLADDLAQTKNVIKDHPEVVKELSAIIEAEYATIPDIPVLGWIGGHKASAKK